MPCRFEDHPTALVTPAHSLVAIDRNRWSRSIGIGGRNQSEQVVAISRNAHSANPARRTHYAAAFTSRTLGEDPVGGKPFIAIGSLGSTLNVQGRLKREDFDAMRETARKSKNEIPPGAQEYANRLGEGLRRLYGPDAPIVGKAVLLAYLEPDDRSFVTVALTSGSIRGEKVYFLSLAKLIFVQSCLAYINAAFPLGLISFQRVSEIALELDVR